MQSSKLASSDPYKRLGETRKLLPNANEIIKLKFLFNV